MASHSLRLRSILSMAQPRLTSLIHDVWFHPRLRELYPEFLFATYGVTVSSAPAMRTAAELCASKDSGPLELWLKDYYLEHAMEEEDHGKWLLEDLNSLGISRSRVFERIPYPSVAALVGSQYYWMKHVHPIAYLGFIAVLEAPTELQFLKEISDRSGIPWKSMSCHVRHAELDEDHIVEFDAMLDSLPLNTEHQDLITVSAISTIGYLEQVFSDVLEHFDRIGNPACATSIFTASKTVLA